MSEQVDFVTASDSSISNVSSDSDDADVAFDTSTVEVVRPTLKTMVAAAGIKKLLITQNRSRDVSKSVQEYKYLDEFNYSHVSNLLPAELLSIEDAVSSQLDITDIDSIVKQNLISARASFHSYWKSSSDPQDILRSLNSLKCSSDFTNDIVTAAQDYIASALESKNHWMTLVKHKDILVNWITYKNNNQVTLLTSKVSELVSQSGSQKDEIERLTLSQQQLRETVSKLQVRSVLSRKFAANNKRNNLSYEIKENMTEKPCDSPSEENIPKRREAPALASPSSNPSPSKWRVVSSRQACPITVLRDIVLQFVYEFRSLCLSIKSIVENHFSQLSSRVAETMSVDLKVFLPTVEDSTTVGKPTTSNKKPSREKLITSRGSIHTPHSSRTNSEAHVSFIKKTCALLDIPAEVCSPEQISETEANLTQKIKGIVDETTQVEQSNPRTAFLDQVEDVSKLVRELDIPIAESCQKVVSEFKKLVTERSNLVHKRIVRNTKYRKALVRVKQFDVEQANRQQRQHHQQQQQQQRQTATSPKSKRQVLPSVAFESASGVQRETITTKTQSPSPLQQPSNSLIPSYIPQLDRRNSVLVINIKANYIKKTFLDSPSRAQEEFCLWLETFRRDLRRYINRVTEAEAVNVLKQRNMLTKIRNLSGLKEVRRQSIHREKKNSLKFGLTGSAKTVTLTGSSSLLPFEPPALPSQPVPYPSKAACKSRKKSCGRFVSDSSVFINSSSRVTIGYRVNHYSMPSISRRVSKKSNNPILKWIRRNDTSERQSNLQQLLNPEQSPALPVLIG